MGRCRHRGPRIRRASWALAGALLAAGCQGEQGDPGPARAGVVTSDNLAEVVPGGATAAGRVGDYYLRNQYATFIVQRPGRELSLGPYGGSLIDVALPGGHDHFGELIPTIALGRTLRVNAVLVISDGSDGGDAVIEAFATDATNVYYNLEGIVPALLSYLPEGGGLLRYDPEAPMGLSVRIRYALPPDEGRLTITYTFTNASAERRAVPLGFLIDARGTVETFNPGVGFEQKITKSFGPENISELLSLSDRTEQTVLFNDAIAMGILPRRIDERSPPQVVGVTVPALGGALVLEADTLLDAASDPVFRLAPGARGEVEVDVLVAARPHEILERGRSLLGVEQVEVSGCVVTPAGDPVAGVRVGLEGEAGAANLFITDGRGCFEGRVPPGSYIAVAGAPYRPASEPVAFEAPGSVELELAPLGQVAVEVEVYDHLDATEPMPHPCRLTLIGPRAEASHPLLYGAQIDDARGVVHRLWHLRRCDDGGPVEVAPGRYLAYVTRGPEHTRIEQLIDVEAGGDVVRITGALRRVVDTAGYAASDFHVHSVYSADSAVPAEQRVLSLASEAMDFWASLEHDVVVDYTAHIAALGLEAELATVPGAEVTTFDTGHFGAYPLPVRPDLANGGSPDWALREDGTRPVMQELFDEIHGRGALVQVNHPRGGGVDIGNHFTRAGVAYDPETRQPYQDPALQTIENRHIRYPEGVRYFSADFDIIEVVNGIGTYAASGMAYMRDVDRVGHDWMNLLSAGRRIVAVANSDTHDFSEPPGNPRTLVGGHDGGPVGIMAALAAGDAVLTTGPMVRATLRDAGGAEAGLGQVLGATSEQVTLQIEVQTPDWYRVEAFDVLANVFFPDLDLDAPAPTVVGVTALDPQPMARPNGGTAYVATAQVELDLATLGPPSEDAWVVVRVGGTSTQLHPLMFSGGGNIDPAGETPETFYTDRWGPLPWAMTNPIFVDRDGDGLWRGTWAGPEP